MITLLTKRQALEQSKARLAASPQWGAARFDDNMLLHLHFLKHNQVLLIDMSQLGSTVIVGRYDPNTDLLPGIDLTLLDALDMGVSRCHFQLEVVNNMLRITDLDSMNGTSINGVLLAPFSTTLLRDGDELQIGLLKCMVYFQAKP